MGQAAGGILHQNPVGCSALMCDPGPVTSLPVWLWCYRQKQSPCTPSVLVSAQGPYLVHLGKYMSGACLRGHRLFPGGVQNWVSEAALPAQDWERPPSGCEAPICSHMQQTCSGHLHEPGTALCHGSKTETGTRQ